MELKFLILLAVVIFLHCAQGQEDCHRSIWYTYYFLPSQHQCSNTIIHGGSSSLTGFNCGPDYECCDNACCKRNSETIPSDMETVGVVLSATAMFTIIILALMIFGATFYSNKEDDSTLFRKRKELEKI